MTSRSLRRALLATALLITLTPAATAAVVFDGIAAGDASSTDAILWTRTENDGSTTGLIAQVAPDPDFQTSLKTFSGTTSADADFTLKLLATGLTSNTKYYYRFMAGNVASGTGQFFTAPTANQKVDVKFGFSGDADGRFRPYPSIANLAVQKLNYFIFLGDTMYETASKGSPEVPVISGATINPADLSSALTAYNQKYLHNLRGVEPATGRPSAFGQPGLQPMLAATGTYTLLDNHELGNRSLQSGGAPPTAPQSTTDPAFDVNQTGGYNNKSAAFRTAEKSYLDYHPTRASILGTPASGYTLDGPRVNAPSDPRSDGTPRLYFAEQWGANSVYIQTDDRSYRDIRLSKPSGNGTTDDLGSRADNPNRSILGATQLEWLKGTLLRAQMDGTLWKFIVISSPIDQVGGRSAARIQANGQPSGVQAPDGKSWWGGYRSERNLLLKFIADSHVDHVVFLATDDHQTRVTQLQYLTDPTDWNSKAIVPGSFQIMTGPIGGGGPDTYTDHDFATIETAANNRNASQLALGEPLLGLPADYPGLRNVLRQGDPNAPNSPSPVDFYSPDTFNYTILNVAADGVLTVETWGIPSYQQNTFPQVAIDPSLIFSFRIGAPLSP